MWPEYCVPLAVDCPIRDSSVALDRQILERRQYDLPRSTDILREDEYIPLTRTEVVSVNVCRIANNPDQLVLDRDQTVEVDRGRRKLKNELIHLEAG